ncbi:hypothetical protein [Trichococcus shcherbakoviae]|uniref:hypothetical protein n=1 Tax=Trichococcus shcherbakoviae TaxID=2094020 RepID=UPI002AA6F100|nr:hypothetical protein [Trichococcus shcherbakoviae]
MASRIDIDQSTVLERVVAQLRSALNLGERQVYETLDTNYLPRIPTGGAFFLAVSAADSTFPEGEQTPGNLTEDWGVFVTAYTRIKLDSTDRDEKTLRDASRGLLSIKRKILAALVGQDLTTEDGDTFLRQTLFARSCGRPEAKEMPNKVPIGVITLEFGVSFDWDVGLDFDADGEE